MMRSQSLMMNLRLYMIHMDMMPFSGSHRMWERTKIIVSMLRNLCRLMKLVMEILMKVCVFSISRVSETLRSYSAETRRMSFLRESRMKCWINVRHILRMMIHSVDISH